MMQKCSYFILFLLLLVLAGCSYDDLSERNHLSRQWMKPNGKIKTLASIGMIHDLIQQVGGEYVDCCTLIAGELDPHSYQLVKGDDEKLAFADLIFFNGLGLEHGPGLQSYLFKHSKAISLGDKILNDDRSSILDYKGQVDPHIWMDVALWARAVPFIVEALSQQDPAHAQSYRDNGDRTVQEMMHVHEEIKMKLHEIPSAKRYLVTSHDAFNYFVRAYLADEDEPEALWQERFAAPEGLAPDSQLGTHDIQKIISHLKKYHIRVLFPESNLSKDSIRKIVSAARESGEAVTISTVSLYADAMGKPGSDGDTYLKMIKHNAKTIAEHLHPNNLKNCDENLAEIPGSKFQKMNACYKIKPFLETESRELPLNDKTNFLDSLDILQNGSEQ